MKPDLFESCIIAGLACLAAGCLLISPATALIVVGGLLYWFGWWGVKL